MGLCRMVAAYVSDRLMRLPSSASDASFSSPSLAVARSDPARSTSHSFDWSVEREGAVTWLADGRDFGAEGEREARLWGLVKRRVAAQVTCSVEIVVVATGWACSICACSRSFSRCFFVFFPPAHGGDEPPE